MKISLNNFKLFMNVLCRKSLFNDNLLIKFL